MLERAQQFSSWIHGFTTRHGGVSEGRFASLNLGGKWGDDPQAVATNRRRVAEAAGFHPDDLRLVRQVHGAQVIRARDLERGSQADAIWCHRDDPPVVVGVLTADCVPVLLADRAGTVACAVHSGWRGTVAGIVPAAVETMGHAGVSAGDLRAAIGPCIELDAFEVSPEVADRFPAPCVDRTRWPRPHVDLVQAVRAQLTRAGVPPQAIERVGGCTHRDASRYFSYRRDGAGIGQMLSFIGYSSAGFASTPRFL
jgi:hypothetical protein